MSCDTINWPLEFQEFKRLDTVLKCGICYEFMSTCMMTSCCHNYCSLCIRKFMQYKTQCPTCFEETFEMHLRNNRLIDDVISVYTQVRDKLVRSLRIAALAPQPPSSPQVAAQPLSQSPLTPKCHSTPNGPPLNSFFPSKTGKGKGAGVSVKLFPDTPSRPKASTSEDLVVNGVKVPGMFNSPKASNLTKVKKEEEMTQCPVCSVSVPKKNINLHLDACLARSDPSTLPQPKPKVKKREPLVKRLYHLMPDKALRKSLKDYGLSSTGDRKALINRIQRYVVLYNAEADKDNPRPIFDLISQVEREEREEKKQPSLLKSMHARMTIDRKTDPEIIEKVNKEYCNENKESFNKLIEGMRAREGKTLSGKQASVDNERESSGGGRRDMAEGMNSCDETLEGVSNLDETLPGPSWEQRSELHSSNESLFEPCLLPSSQSQKKKTGKSPFSCRKRQRKKEDDAPRQDDNLDPIENSFREGSELFHHLASMFPGLEGNESDSHSSVENKDTDVGSECEEPIVPGRRRSKRNPLPNLEEDVGDRHSVTTRSRTKRLRPSSPS